MIDMKTLGRFRFAIEQGGRASDPWALLLLCQHGHIYPHGPDRLAFASRCRGPIANRVAALPGARVEQEAGDGWNISFPVDLFARVAKIVGAKRRRSMSSEQRAAARERLRLYRFRTADKGHTLPPSGRSDGERGQITPPRHAVQDLYAKT